MTYGSGGYARLAIGYNPNTAKAVFIAADAVEQAFQPATPSEQSP